MAFPIIPKKRSGATGSPTSLTVGELAVNTATGELFLGGDSAVLLLNPPTAAGTTTTEATGDGTTTAFAFTGFNGTADGGYLVSVGGIDQPPSKYSVTDTAGGTLTFVEAPTDGELISIRAIVAGSGGGGGTGDATSLQGVAISDATPSTGQLLEFTGAEWEPKYTTELGTAYTSEGSGYTAARLGGNTYATAGGVAIGDTARALGSSESIAIGIYATANSNVSMAIGQYAQATGLNSIAIGESANASGAGICIGKNAVSTGGLSINAPSLTGSPVDPSTVVAHMQITLNDTVYYMPLYQ
jgi:hypothetical protein